MSLSRSSEPGLSLLRQACEYACQLKQDQWEFAVEIQELKSSGMTVNDLRWLMLAGYVEHACEEHGTEVKRRKFRGQGRRRFNHHSCFVLTKNGLAFVAHRLTGADAPAAKRTAERSLLRPVWDSVRHELLLNGQIVKRFKQNSPNQEAVLTAFQEENWPSGVLDPLSPIPNQDCKQRLRDTIKNLNRHQINARIHFSGDGSGERVLWDVVGSN